MSAVKTGPLTLEELEVVWQATNDRGFTRALQEAGEGQGYEAYTQMFAQMARVSLAVDVTTQAMFILPHSAQTQEPAGGERKATVALTFSRTKLLNQPLILTQGQLWVDEAQMDWNANGGELVNTGRRYVLLQSVVFPPGVQGPVTVQAEAERPGWGYNNPLPLSIAAIEQPGSGFNNELATVRIENAGVGTPVSPTLAAHAYLDAANEADAFIPDHVGQYVQFTAGVNTGIARMVSYGGPNPSAHPPTGGTVELMWLGVAVAASAGITGTFVLGEQLALKDVSFGIQGYATLLDIQTVNGFVYLTYQQKNFSGAFTGAITTLTGLVSSAQAHLTSVLVQPAWQHDAGGAAWEVLDWAADWGLTCSNARAPSGGRLGFLDEIGKERNIARAPLEDDESYRERIAQPADVVTPNAIRRTLARVLGDLPWCFREVGTPSLPGFFFDHDFYDYDSRAFTPGATSGSFIPNEPVLLKSAAGLVHGTGYFAKQFGGTIVYTHRTGEPAVGDSIVGTVSGATATMGTLVETDEDQRRFTVYLGYREFRGYFLVGVPEIAYGDFGFAYDHHPFDAFDASFFDGYPVGGAALYRTVVQAVDQARAGGVSFDIYLETGSCS